MDDCRSTVLRSTNNGGDDVPHQNLQQSIPDGTTHPSKVATIYRTPRMLLYIHQRLRLSTVPQKEVTSYFRLQKGRELSSIWHSFGLGHTFIAIVKKRCNESPTQHGAVDSLELFAHCWPHLKSLFNMRLTAACRAYEHSCVSLRAYPRKSGVSVGSSTFMSCVQYYCQSTF